MAATPQAVAADLLLFIVPLLAYATARQASMAVLDLGWLR
jgi:hypothetical protein